MASTVLNNNEMFYTKYIFFHNCVHISNIKDKHNNKCVSIYMNMINITIINTGATKQILLGAKLLPGLFVRLSVGYSDTLLSQSFAPFGTNMALVSF